MRCDGDQVYGTQKFAGRRRKRDRRGFARPAAANELVCGFSGQAYLAGTALAPTDGNYVKIKCTRATSADGTPTETASDTLAGSPGN
jgi:hypothetical protein